MIEKILAILATFTIAVISEGYLGIVLLMAIEIGRASRCRPRSSCHSPAIWSRSGGSTCIWRRPPGAIGCNLGSIVA